MGAAITRDGRVAGKLDHFSTFGTLHCVPVEDPDQEGCREPVADLCSDCPGIHVGWSLDQCVQSGSKTLWFVDRDEDTVDDWCEYDLAYEFRPQLVFMPDCNWDAGLNRMGGEYFFAASISRGSVKFPQRGAVRLIYMPAYYHDCGLGAEDEEAFDRPHSGDSEFIIIDLGFDKGTNHWLTSAVFLSAHCEEITGAKCQEWPPSAFLWVAERVGAPFVYVAERKHANYPSVGECLWFERCSSSGPTYRYPIWTSANIGQGLAQLVNCTQGLSSRGMKDPGVGECLWTSSRFNGWQAEVVGGGSKGYTTRPGRYGGF